MRKVARDTTNREKNPKQEMDTPFETPQEFSDSYSSKETALFNKYREVIDALEKIDTATRYYIEGLVCSLAESLNKE